MSEFEILVKEMRDTQKEYFRTRDKATLAKSKALEKKVDDHFLSVVPAMTGLKSPEFKQNVLF